MKKRMKLIVGLMILSLCACTRNESINVQETESNIENAIINWEGDCEVFGKEAENITGIIKDIESLVWIAPRGGAGIVSEGKEIQELENEYIIQSNVFLTDEENICQSISSETWVRLIRKPVSDQVGTTESAYKDIIIYRQNDNVCLAVQSSENLTKWTLWELPQYGVWLEKEVAIFMRIATGL